MSSQPKLRILVAEAQQLQKRDVFGLSDPYVKLVLRYSNHRQRSIGKTQVIKKTLQPTWNEVFEVKVPRDRPFTVILDVYDENILIKDDYLGRTMLHFELSSMQQGVSGTNHHMASQIEAHGITVNKILHNKYNPENLNGYLRFQHVREMSRDFTSRKFDKASDMGKNWGSIKLSYVIYDPLAPPTPTSPPVSSATPAVATPTTSVSPTVNSLPYPLPNQFPAGANPLPYPTDNIPGGSSTNASLPYPTAQYPSTAPQQPLSYPIHNQPSPQISHEEHDEVESDESDSEVELPSGWDRRVDSNGRNLYVNHHHRQVSLRHPNRMPPRQPRTNAAATPQQQEGGGASTTNQSVPSAPQLIPSAPNQPEPSAPQLPLPSTPQPINAHPRQFLGRSHSLDVMGNIPGVSEEEESVTDESPPNADIESVLQRLDAIIMNIPGTATPPSPTPGVNQGATGSSPGVSSLGVSSPGPTGTSGTSSSPSAARPQLNTALQRAAEGLPSNWEASMTPAGRIYYIDHTSQTTTWEKPRFKEIKPTVDPAPATPTPVEQEADLPEGWEARKDAKTGRTYYVDHKTKRTTWDHPSKATTKDELGPLPSGWEMKQMKDGRIFYIDHTTHSTQWEDPRLLAKNKPTAKIQYSRDYKQKYTNFKQKLFPKHNIPNQCEIPCRRDHLFEDSYNVIMNIRDAEKLKSRLYVIFDGESGLDYGGLAREWFYLLSHEMFNPYYGLFEYSASDDYTLQINPDSGLCNENHLDYFKFIGRVCGMAVYHNRLLDAFFIRPFYKMMLRKPIALDDMQSVDVEMWNSITYILENDPEPLCLDFSVNKKVFDEVIQVDLKPDGRNIPVTQKNKKEYINLMIKWRFSDRITKQMDAFLEGFSALVPLHTIKVFDERELEYLLGGLAQIDVEDWKAHTEYNGYSNTDQVVTWFWKAVENYDGEMRARLLQFVTGTSKVPMNGFSELQGSQGPRKFCIKKFGEATSLPRAHTCFNRLDLPPYHSYHKLKEMLRIAVENTEGFEGVD